MEYTSTEIGRIFIAKFSNDEDMLEGLKKLFVKEQIDSAIFFIVGAIKQSNIVSGPKRDIIPPKPYWQSIDKAHEIIGIGNMFKSENEPKIHLHTTFARKDEIRMGCIRDLAKVFLLVEAIVFELIGANLFKSIDENTGLLMLKGFDKSI